MSVFILRRFLLESPLLSPHYSNVYQMGVSTFHSNLRGSYQSLCVRQKCPPYTESRCLIRSFRTSPCRLHCRLWCLSCLLCCCLDIPVGCDVSFSLKNAVWCVDKGSATFEGTQLNTVQFLSRQTFLYLCSYLKMCS